MAVLAVVGFHASPYWVKGGFTGVDVFFVISGYLISTVILGSLQAGRFTFGEFYARRIRRIFPALLLVLVASLALGWFVLLADEYRSLGKHVAAGAGFVSNFAFWNESGYFDAAAETKPLLHLWSLGIEEQYYIAWPLLLWLGWKWRTNILAIAIVIGAISFALNVATVRGDAVAAFYSPQTRFWELMAGSILAYAAMFRPNALAASAALRNAQAVLGAALVAFGILFVSREMPFPGWWALPPVIGTALIISAGPQAWLNRAVLSHRVLVWFGLISFPLYLWHWPLLSFARILEIAPSRELRVAAILASIALAWLTYRLVERPIRYGHHGKAKAIALFVLMLIIGGAGLYCYQRDGFEFRFREFAKITRAAGEWEFPGNSRPFVYKDVTFQRRDSGMARTTLFLGDSNVEQYYARIDELATTRPASTHSAIFATGGQCVPIPGVVVTYPHCNGVLEKAIELALSRSDISTVVIGAQWWGYLGGGSRRHFNDDGRELAIEKGSAGYRKALAALSGLVARLKAGGKQVYLVLSIPTAEELDPRYMAQRSLRNFPNVIRVRDGGIGRRALLDKYGFVNEDLAAIAATQGVGLIDPMESLCDKDLCPSVDRDNEPMYRDAAHLRPSYVRSRATFMDATVAN